MKKLLLSILLSGVTLISFSQISAKLFQYPDVSDSQITFSYAGDIWIVSKNGGTAFKLISPKGQEIFPKFSPDGKTIAFSGNYNGNTDVFSISVSGGIPKRLTYHGYPDRVVDWHPDGEKVLFASRRESGKERFNQFYYTGIENGLSEKLPLEHAEYGSISKDGKTIAFTDYDVHFPSMGPNDIVYEAGGKLYLYNFEDNQSSEVQVNVITDQQGILPKTVKVGKNIQNGWISPDGKRVAFEARGDIFSVPAEHGYIKNLTQTSGVAERFPAWSPDGKQLAYWSDVSGEYQLILKNLESNLERSLTSFKDGFRYQPQWSPDSEKLVFIDQTMAVKLLFINTSELVTIDKLLFQYQGGLSNFSVSWDANSQWVAYAKDTPKRSQALALFNVENRTSTQVTSGYYNDSNPTFDPDGKFLYFLTNRHFSPDYSDFDNSFIYQNATMVAAATLTNDIKSPLAFRNDSVEIKSDDKKDDAKNDKKEKDKKSKEEDKLKPKETKIDIDGFESRVVLMPMKPGNYNSVEAVSGKIIYVTRKGNSSDLKYYDLKKRKEEVILSGIQGYQLSANNKKILVRIKGKFAVITPDKGQKADKFLATQDMIKEIIPKEEWRQLFREAWRLQRDYFYDKGMHGVDWLGVYNQYLPLLEQCNTRWDVKSRSPLLSPGVNVNVGDYILAVNGFKIDIDKEPHAAFQGLGGKTVELTVSSKPDFADAKKVIVKTMSSEFRIRHLQWIESKRSRVEEATNGEAGYIFVTSTGIDGQNELVRQFMGQWNKPALIIDERFNNGGQIPDRFIELLNRKPLAYWAVRDGAEWSFPPIAHFGPKVMLINGWSGSGGDAFPDYFRKSNLGPLIGTRTWGGLIGYTGAPRLIDGGTITVPSFRMYDPGTGAWFKEGHGVDPDITVDEDAGKLASGIDPQLEKAIEVIKDKLKTEAYSAPKHPPVENRHN